VVKQEIDKYKVQVQDPDFFEASASPAGTSVPSLQRPAPASTSPSAPTAKPQAQR
jgi:hypothetical protein